MTKHDGARRARGGGRRPRPRPGSASSASHTTPSRSSTQFKDASLSCQYRTACPASRRSRASATPRDDLALGHRAALRRDRRRRARGARRPPSRTTSCASTCREATATIRYADAGDAAARVAGRRHARRPTTRPLYLYRMTLHRRGRPPPRTTRRASARSSSSRPATGDILPHEHTTPKAKSDRLDLLRATAANLSPIWGLSLADGLSELLDRRTRRRSARGATTTASRHELLAARPTRPRRRPSPRRVVGSRS